MQKGLSERSVSERRETESSEMQGAEMGIEVGRRIGLRGIGSTSRGVRS